MQRILGTKKNGHFLLYIYVGCWLPHDVLVWQIAYWHNQPTRPSDTTKRHDQPTRPTDTRTHLANATANWHVPGRRKRHRRWERKKDVNENNPCLSNDNKMGNEKKRQNKYRNNKKYSQTWARQQLRHWLERTQRTKALTDRFFSLGSVPLEVLWGP